MHREQGIHDLGAKTEEREIRFAEVACEGRSPERVKRSGSERGQRVSALYQGGRRAVARGAQEGAPAFGDGV